LLMITGYLLKALGKHPCCLVVAVHVWVIDGDCIKVERVELVLGELYDGSEEKCTVAVMLLLKEAAEVTNLHVDN
jgi:hypothetical protein